MVGLARRVAVTGLVLVFATGPSVAGSPNAEALWHEDFAEAERRALEESKALLLYFTGSDWCVWCQKLDSEALSDSGLAAHIAPLAVPVRIDFPQRRKLPPRQDRANASLKDRWQVEAIPTVVLFDPQSGKELWRHGYLTSSSQDYADGIRKALAKARGLDIVDHQE